MIEQCFYPDQYVEQNRADFAGLALVWACAVLKPLQEIREIRQGAGLEPTFSSVADSRKNLASILDAAHDRHQVHTITKHGKPFGCIISEKQANVLDVADAVLGQFVEDTGLFDGSLTDENREEALFIFYECFGSYVEELAAQR